MKLHIVAGWKTLNASSKPDCLYWGQDGVEAVQAARKAQESGKYSHGCIKSKLVTTWVPHAAVPTKSPAAVEAKN